MRKIFFLGLDSAPPKVIYDNYGVEFEALREVVEDGQRYLMRSCYPPITIPAWMVMFTGKTPGELGIYGFRHRRPGDVKHSYIVNSRYIKAETLWEKLSKMGRKVGVIGVPPTFPPKPMNGFMITDFTTPGPQKSYTWPPWLKRELEKKFGPYIFDVTYRSEDKDSVARDIFEMTAQHLEIVKYLLGKKEWEFLAYVEIGVDRIHHAFWKYFDRDHPRYTYHPTYSEIIPRYYRMIDRWFSEIRNILPKDAIIVIASDHGVKPMKGAFVINQWLQEKGYLKLRKDGGRPGQDLDGSMIDWGSTAAWAWGGYYSRIFINLDGREPKGAVKQEEYEEILNQLKKDLLEIHGPRGEEWRTEAYAPRELYPETNGDPPDLMLYLDDLSWRPAGTIGWRDLYLPENDRGPDDAVHDWHGVFTVYDPEGSIDSGMLGKIDIKDVHGLLLELIME